MTDMMADETSRQTTPARRFSERLLPSALVYWAITCGVMLALTLPTAKDYIGPDNDDVMRLVEVRDWLSGQGWFDLMQYRLGLDGGTLMHWSRLVDVPIGLLIRFFSLFLPTHMAEAVAATLWPLLTLAPLVIAVGLAGRRLGGTRAMHIALGLGALFAFACGKFRPGALDHHNVQLVLAMWVAALLADKRGRPLDHACAGVAAALAIAIGAETVPFIAIACLCVAARWIWQGEAFASGAGAFGLSLALTITAAFFATIPPSAYTAVTCDNLSFGFYTLTALGGAGLFLLTRMPAGIALGGRVAASLGFGTVIGAVAVYVAPQCLGSPLASLDPMLVELWLNNVSEAKSIVSQARSEPYTLGGFYAVGLIASFVCAVRAWQGKERGLHLFFLTLIAFSWAISLVQLRGSFFANLMSIPPLAFAIADLQQRVRENSKDIAATLGFVFLTLFSTPTVWAFIGAVWDLGLGSVNMSSVSGIDSGNEDGCDISASEQQLRALPAGIVAAPSNSGAYILRYSQHRVLSAPYHRNQGGMLTELHIGMSKPEEALAFLKGAGVTILAFCKGDPATVHLADLKKDGLYAELSRGDVPTYLTPIGGVSGGLQLYGVNPDAPK